MTVTGYIMAGIALPSADVLSMLIVIKQYMHDCHDLSL